MSAKITLYVEPINRTFYYPFDYGVINALKSIGARFDGTEKKWTLKRLPLCTESAKALGLAELCVDGNFYRSYVYTPLVDEDEVKSKTCYTIERWTLDEDDRPTKVEETICLSKRTERGDWQIPRGLAKRFKLKLPQFADLPELEPSDALRDYQRQVAESAWRQLKDIGAATIQMATGAGKSYLSGYLAKQLNRAGYTVFAVALSLDLIYQLADFAKAFGAEVIPVTIQTLYRRISDRENGEEKSDPEDEEVYKAYADEVEISDDVLQRFYGKKVAVIMDEVHHLPARTVKAVMRAAGEGEALRIGLSATPWRNDGRDLEIYAYTGDVVEPRISSSFLIEHGFAVPVDIEVVRGPPCRTSGAGEGATAYAIERRELAGCKERNEFIVELAAKAEKPVLVITQLVKHAETLYKMAKAAGLNAELATGAVKGEVRKQIYDRIRGGLVDVLVATTLADEGLDLPPLRSLIIAMGGKSKTRTLQRIGRLVRPWPNKTKAIAYEIYDPGTQFFRLHLRERLRLYRTEPAWRIIGLS
jgi:superfamily II DNA or RNA helicase